MGRTIHIGIIGDFDANFLPHPATDSALQHAASFLDLSLEWEWVPTKSFEQEAAKTAGSFDGLWCAPGAPYQSLNGAIAAIEFARKSNTPLIGTCGGFQHVVLEFARNELKFVDAQHAEYDPYASTLFISKLVCSLAGKTMRVHLTDGSAARKFFACESVSEHYYCNFGLNPDYHRLLEEGGLLTTGVDDDGEVRILELPDHPFFIGTLFVPQTRSTEQSPHPLIVEFVRAASERSQ